MVDSSCATTDDYHDGGCPYGWFGGRWGDGLSPCDNDERSGLRRKGGSGGKRENGNDVAVLVVADMPCSLVVDSQPLCPALLPSSLGPLRR